MILVVAIHINLALGNESLTMLLYVLGYKINFEIIFYMELKN